MDHEEEELDGAVTGLGFGLVPVAAAPASLVTLGVWERAEFFLVAVTPEDPAPPPDAPCRREDPTERGGE